jgi:hypothetical protein
MRDVGYWVRPGPPMRDGPSPNIKELLKEISVSSTYIYRDITHMKMKVFIVERI